MIVVSDTSMKSLPVPLVDPVAEVSPKRKTPLSDFHIDVSNYKVTDGGHVPDYTYYTDACEGVKFEVSSGLVVSITYFPSAEEDGRLRCRRRPIR